MAPNGAGRTGLRMCLACDPHGRALFVPWYPLSRTAYVLKDPVQREKLRRHMELYAMFAIGLVFGIGMAGIFSDASLWLPLASSVLLIVYWVWWAWRSSRGLEKTRYEKAGA